MPIPDFLAEIGVTQTAIAIAHNGAVIPRAQLAAATLQDGDTLEIVRAVGGG